MNALSSTIIQRLRIKCNDLRNARRLSVARQVDSAVEAGLVRAVRLRHEVLEGGVASVGEAVLRSAFEGRL